MTEPPKAMRRSQFATLPTPEQRILFLGDSITEFGMWHEWFSEWPTLNRGIGGETVAEIHARLDTAVNDPLAISVLAGTNDITGLGESRRPRDIGEDMRVLLSDLRRRVPLAPIVLNSVMPRRPRLAERLQDLNDRYRSLAAKFDCTFLDLWPILADDRQALAAHFTMDRLHLTGAGYAAWVSQLRGSGLLDNGESTT